MMVPVILEGPAWMLSYFPFLAHLGNSSSIPGGPSGSVVRRRAGTVLPHRGRHVTQAAAAPVLLELGDAVVSCLQACS